MKNNDTQLIRLTLEGDDTAFAELVEKYQKQVHALVWRKIGDFHIAEEITQDTFLKAYNNLATLKQSQSFASWLYVIATSRCNSWLQKKYRRTQLMQGIDTLHPQQTTYSEHVLEENERIAEEAQREVVKKLLAKLGESERTVMTLHYFGEMSCSEIGKFMGVSTNTIKSRLRRAQQRLQKEETMIREALDNFQITPHFTENVMREISRINPATPNSSKPVVPWTIAASTLAVVLLILGFGNSKYLTRFQKPYSLDANAEMTVEIVDVPIVANLESKQGLHSQIAIDNVPGNTNSPEKQPNDAVALSAEAQIQDNVEDNTPVKAYTQWELPKKAKARLGKGGIRAMQFSPDGSKLAVGSNIGVWLYDVKTGKELNMFPGMCQSLTFSPDGRFLANSGGKFFSEFAGKPWGKGLNVWEINTNRKVPLPANVPYTSIVRFSDDGKTLVSLRKAGSIIGKLDVETGQWTENNIAEPFFSFQPIVYAITHDRYAIGGMNGMFDVRDLTSGQELLTIKEQDAKKHVCALAFSPDGRWLATGDKDTTIHLWDTIRKDKPFILQKHTGWVTVLAFLPDGKMLASGSTDKTVQLWNTTTREALDTFTGYINGISALTFSPDGSMLASGSAEGTIRFWNTKTGNLQPTQITEHTEWIPAVTFLKDSTMLASVAFNGIITFWDLNTLQKTDQHIFGYRDWLSAVAISPDGSKFASIAATGNAIFEVGNGISNATAMPDMLIRLKDINTGQELKTLTGARNSASIAFSPDGKTVAFGGHGNIRVWHTETDENFDIHLPDHSVNSDSQRTSKVSALVFSPDGKNLVSGTRGGKVQMWDTETGIMSVPNFLFVGQETNDENTQPIIRATVNQPSDVQITDDTIKPEVRTPIITYHEPILVLAFSSDGAMLAVGTTKRIRLLGITKQIVFKELHHGAQVLLFSPDNTVLLCGLSIGRIELWDLTTASKLATLDGHTAPVGTLVFSPDGKTLVSTGEDGTILLWDWDEVLKELTEK